MNKISAIFFCWVFFIREWIVGNKNFMFRAKNDVEHEDVEKVIIGMSKRMEEKEKEMNVIEQKGGMQKNFEKEII